MKRTHPHMDRKKATKGMKDKCPFCKELINAVHYHKAKCDKNPNKKNGTKSHPKTPSKKEEKETKKKMVIPKTNKKEEKSSLKEQENDKKGEKVEKKEQEDPSYREQENDGEKAEKKKQDFPNSREQKNNKECGNEDVDMHEAEDIEGKRENGNTEEHKDAPDLENSPFDDPYERERLMEQCTPFVDFNKSKTKIKIEVQDENMGEEPEDEVELVTLDDDDSAEENKNYDAFLIHLQDVMERNVVDVTNNMEKKMEELKKFFHSETLKKWMAQKEDKNAILRKLYARLQKTNEELKRQIDTLKKKNDVELFLEENENSIFKNKANTKIWIPMDLPGAEVHIFKGPHGMEWEQTKGPTLDQLTQFQSRI